MKKYNKVILMSLITLLVSSSCYSSQFEILYEQCLKEVDDQKRLECYDDVAKNSSLVKEVLKESGKDTVGSWIISRNKSKMDDSKTFFAVSTPIDGKSGDALYVRCHEKKSAVFVTLSSFLGLSDHKSLQYRIDQGKVKTAQWNMGTDNKTIFAPNPVQFAKEISTGKSLIVRIETYGDGTKTIEIPLEGVEEIISELAETCGWKK